MAAPVGGSNHMGKTALVRLLLDREALTRENEANLKQCHEKGLETIAGGDGMWSN